MKSYLPNGQNPPRVVESKKKKISLILCWPSLLIGSRLDGGLAQRVEAQLTNACCYEILHPINPTSQVQVCSSLLASQKAKRSPAKAIIEGRWSRKMKDGEGNHWRPLESDNDGRRMQSLAAGGVGQ
ncbi:hypothetical protein ANN_24209 [Periplaneta americana]|uniref:Uncharacterized protein n=1 Tax=Periplaneta americana TaxID=6978 RepID=A0ABQ8S2S7_PERAM|nr:hypothetical protein ANN_24209 [Periplaneta americana]